MQIESIHLKSSPVQSDTASPVSVEWILSPPRRDSRYDCSVSRQAQPTEKLLRPTVLLQLVSGKCIWFFHLAFIN